METRGERKPLLSLIKTGNNSADKGREELLVGIYNGLVTLENSWAILYKVRFV